MLNEPKGGFRRGRGGFEFRVWLESSWLASSPVYGSLVSRWIWKRQALVTILFHALFPLFPVWIMFGTYELWVQRPPIFPLLSMLVLSCWKLQGLFLSTRSQTGPLRIESLSPFCLVFLLLCCWIDLFICASFSQELFMVRRDLHTEVFPGLFPVALNLSTFLISLFLVAMQMASAVFTG